MKYSFSTLHDFFRKHTRPSLLVVGGIAIVVIVIVLIFFNNQPEDGIQLPGGSLTENEKLLQRLKTVRVPEPGEVSSNKDEGVLAIPTMSIPAAPKTKTKFRSFVLSLSKDVFSASEIVVNKGDIVDISVHAIDHDYSVQISGYNLSQNIPKNSTRVLQFQATQTGVFNYTCDTCSSKNRGHLFVK